MGLFTRNNSQATIEKAAEAAASMPGVVSKLQPPPSRMAPAIANHNAVQLTERQVQYNQMKVRIHQQLVERLDIQNLKSLPPDVVRSEVRVLIRDLCQDEKSLLNGSEQEKLMDDVMDETFGLGPLETLLKDPTIS